METVVVKQIENGFLLTIGKTEKIAKDETEIKKVVLDIKDNIDSITVFGKGNNKYTRYLFNNLMDSLKPFTTSKTKVKVYEVIKPATEKTGKEVLEEKKNSLLILNKWFAYADENIRGSTNKSGIFCRRVDGIKYPISIDRTVLSNEYYVVKRVKDETSTPTLHIDCGVRNVFSVFKSYKHIIEPSNGEKVIAVKTMADGTVVVVGHRLFNGIPAFVFQTLKNNRVVASDKVYSAKMLTEIPSMLNDDNTLFGAIIGDTYVIYDPINGKILLKEQVALGEKKAFHRESLDLYTRIDKEIIRYEVSRSNGRLKLIKHKFPVSEKHFSWEVGIKYLLVHTEFIIKIYDSESFKYLGFVDAIDLMNRSEGSSVYVRVEEPDTSLLTHLGNDYFYIYTLYAPIFFSFAFKPFDWDFRTIEFSIKPSLNYEVLVDGTIAFLRKKQVVFIKLKNNGRTITARTTANKHNPRKKRTKSIISPIIKNLKEAFSLC